MCLLEPDESSGKWQVDSRIVVTGEVPPAEEPEWPTLRQGTRVADFSSLMGRLR